MCKISKGTPRPSTNQQMSSKTNVEKQDFF